MYDASSRNAVCGAICTHPTDNIQSLVRPPVPVALNGVAGYADRLDTAPRSLIDFGAIVACPERGQRMAALYAAAPTYDRTALPAYCAFRDETADQFAYLTAPVARGGLGVTVVRTDLDPYPDAGAMMTDLLEHRRLKIFATAAGDNPHPLLTDDENDMFRAVHDFFGHASTGRGFDRHGEEGAWVKHAGMYSPLARQAMTTETRAVNSSLIWTYGGERFPEQKAVLLPPAFCDPAQFSSRPS